MAGLRRGLAAVAATAAAFTACVAVSLTVAVAPAAGAVPPTTCGKIEVDGKKFQVKAHKVSCEFATRWSRHFLKRGHKPDGWTCARYSGEIAFSCRKGTKSYYAVRR